MKVVLIGKDAMVQYLRTAANELGHTIVIGG